jgi:hypothetical protein
MHGSGYWYRLFGAFDWYKFTTVSLDSVTVVPSFYLYVKAVGQDKDMWL